MVTRCEKIKHMNKSNLLTLFFLCTSYCLSAQWQQLGTVNDPIFPGGPSTKLAINSQNELIAFPAKLDTTGKTGVANWDGISWNVVTELKGEEFYSNHSNHFYASIGTDTMCGAAFFHQIIKWNGLSFDTLSLLNANGVITDIYELPNGHLAVSGAFTDSEKVLIGPCLYTQFGVEYVAEWNGISWDTLGTGSNRKNLSQGIRCFTKDNTGNLYASGNSVDSTGSRFVVKWDGNTWSKVGNITAFGGPILGLACDKNNNVYACGDFFDGTLKHNVRMWNGVDWITLGQGGNELNANGTISTIVTDSYNNVYVAGVFGDGAYKYVAKWDGNSWSNLGNLQANGDINSLTIDSNDNLYCTGWFKENTGHYYIAKYALSPLNIANVKNESIIEVYPNPTKNELNIRTDIEQFELISVNLINSFGESVLNKSFRTSSKGSISIPIEEYKKGVYILKISSRDIHFARKIVIE